MSGYQVFVYPEGAEARELTGAVLELEWGDPAGELAARAVITLAAERAGGLKFNVPLVILADGRAVFEGVIWEVALTDGRRLRLCCYDRLIYLTGSRDSAYFPAGLTTRQVLESICRRWNVELKYTYCECTHGRLNLRGMTVAAQLTRTLDAARALCARRYMLRMEDGALHVGGLGEGGVKCLIDRARLTGYSHRRGMNGLVTRVVVTSGAQGGPVKTRAVVDGDTTLGILQEVVDGAGMSLRDARAQAEGMIAERGTPGETISLECVDEPSLRRGDRVRVEAGSLSGEFDVAGVTHSHRRTMRLELSRHEEG